jgi:hypothetical protein
MGIVKAVEQIADKDFSTILQILEPWFYFFSIAGVGVFIGVLILVFTFPFSTIRKV